MGVRNFRGGIHRQCNIDRALSSRQLTWVYENVLEEKKTAGVLLIASPIEC